MYSQIPYYTIKFPTNIIQHHLLNIFAVASFTAFFSSAFSIEALDWCGVFALALVRVGRHLEVKAISKVRDFFFTEN